MEVYDLPVAFYFSVQIDSTEYAFKEVSGLETELEIESVQEGGLNEYQHSLPKQIKHGNLILKRGLLPLNSALISWVKSIMEGDFSTLPICKSILIQLKNAQGESSYSWTCYKAYPVKWTVEALDSEKNAILLENLEFAYTKINRI